MDTKTRSRNTSSSKGAGKTVVYFRVVRGDSGIYSALIRWYSRSPYTHTEFCWPLDDPEPPKYLGAQPKGGVAIRPFNYLGAQPFDTFAVEVTPKQKAELHALLLSQLGRPYDFRAIAGMVIPALDGGRHALAFFCSELVFYDLAKVGVELLHVPLRQADRITPRDLAISTVAQMVTAK